MEIGTMRRWSLTSIGRQNLRLEHVPIPVPGAAQVLVRVRAVGLNYRDKLIIDAGLGLPLTFPLTPASDFSGIVVACGAEAHRFAEGDPVISAYEPRRGPAAAQLDARNPVYQTPGGTLPGVLAEYVVFPEDWLLPAPATLDPVQASSLPIAGVTAWLALVEYGHIRAGQTVLLQGTGGVSLFGLQIAAMHGAEILITSSSVEKLERAKALGARHGINRTTTDWVDAALKLTSDRGADHIIDIGGGTNLGRSVEAVAHAGRISIVGVFEGFEFSGRIVPMLRKSAHIQGIGLGTREQLAALIRAYDCTGVKPVIDSCYPLADFPEALNRLDRGPFGKVVVDLS